MVLDLGLALPATLPELVAVAVFGLLIGSFLNVVIHRLPKMLEQQWQAEAKAVLATDAGADEAALPDGANRYNLVQPRSACPACGHQIRWYENIPVLSWLYLRAKCSACATAISTRYPLVELSVAVWATYCAWRFGIAWPALAWGVFGAVLLAAALIDWDTTFLPDDLTLPLLWLGLVAAALHGAGLPSLPSAVWGAVGGYMSLWLVFWAFKLLTGKEGMGYGDFKLFAALGAWLGWQALIPVILLASVIGAVVGVVMKLRSSLREGGYVPFGPFLAGAGITAFVFGPQRLLQAVGL